VAITEKVDKLHHALDWRDSIPITNRYTAGLAGERFLRAIQEQGRILGSRCPTCNLIYVPAALFCERCFAELTEWLEAPSTGSVFTFTVVHRDLDEKPLDPPLILAYVKLDGTDGGLVHYLGEVEEDSIDIGMEVEAVFKEPAERVGSILDILYFRPI